MAADAIPDLPAGLAKALEARAASIVESWQEARRVYVRSRSPEGPLFARFSSDPADAETFAHEVAVRSIIGVEGPLRAPPIVAAGRDWLLEADVPAEPSRGRTWVDAATAAAGRIAALALPPASPSPRRPLAVVRRRLRTVMSELPVRDLVRARRIGAALDLPPVTSHGDFQDRNILVTDGVAWVVDWERCGQRPLGWDLMRLWATLELEEDRARLFEGAIDLVGEHRRQQLLRLRYALTVQTIASKLADDHAFNRDVPGARRLLDLLPSLRREAAA